MGEHLPCKQGVMGSNPIISTKYRISESEAVGHKMDEQEKIESRRHKKRSVAQVVRARA